jgi:hypothetical protein
MLEGQRSSQNPILYDQKWHKLLKRARLFKFFPFVDFVLVAGSMALGDVHQNSDFDVIVGTRFGRLYTARFSCLFFYKILGWRRKFEEGIHVGADRFCFNHFVTEKSYCLKPPYNIYWQELYKNLAPVFGDEKKIEEFFEANQFWIQKTKNPALSEVSADFSAMREIRLGNDLIIAVNQTLSSEYKNKTSSELVWGFAPQKSGLPSPISHWTTGPNYNLSQDITFTNKINKDLRFLYKKFNCVKIFLEKVLFTKIGDHLEQLLKKFKLWKIQRNLKRFPPGYKPRIIYNDEEVEIHLDTKRTETIK